MRKHWIAGIVGLTTVALIVIGVAGRGGYPSHRAQAAVAAAAGSEDTAETSPGGAPATIRFARNPAPLPPFLLPDLSGNFVSTVTLRGRVTLVNFWATWCPPCRAEIPELIRLQKRYPERLQILGISLDDGPADEVKKFAEKAGINYPVVMGSRELVSEFGGVAALPTSYLVNAEGGVVQKHVGLYPPEVYNQEIRALLGLPVDAKIETFEDTGQIFLKNAANATELPGVNFSGLTPEQKRAALRQMNSETCTCGCGLTIAQCRINDSACGVSLARARQILEQISGGRIAKKPTAKPKP